MATERLPLWKWRQHLATREGRIRGATALATVALCAYVLVYPFCLVRYPPITDLPFHAASTSIIRHYTDPAFHFHDQFYIDPLSAPYMLQYLVGAGLSLLMPMHVAVKVTCVMLLGCLPLGLALLCRGLGKPPLMGLLALGLVYSTLTHWGFISHIGALGFFAASLGAALMLLEGGSTRQNRRRAWLLGAMLLLTLFSHVYRYPFALTGVLLIALLAKRQGRAWRELRFVGLAALPSLALFLVFWFRRDHVTGADLRFEWTPGRLSELPAHLFGGFVSEVGARERLDGWLWIAWCAVLGLGSYAWRRRYTRTETVTAAEGMSAHEVRTLQPFAVERMRRYRHQAHWLVLLVCVGLLGLYLTLPVTWGSWFFVYPREALSVTYLLLALLPALPRRPLAGLALVAGLAVTCGQQAFLVATQWLGFERLNQDFYAIQTKLPAHPKLLYLIFDHSGTYRSTTPFIHLPAWVQAERGGSLYFHFVRWGLYPIRYRLHGADTPPSLPYLLEWHPEAFRTVEHGHWFDTFLVRHRVDPAVVFEADPEIQLVAHEGEWWLYRRQP